MISRQLRTATMLAGSVIYLLGLCRPAEATNNFDVLVYDNKGRPVRGVGITSWWCSRSTGRRILEFRDRTDSLGSLCILAANPAVSSLDNKKYRKAEEIGLAWARPVNLRRSHFDYLEIGSRSSRMLFVGCGGDVFGGRILVRPVGPARLPRAGIDMKHRIRKRTTVSFAGTTVRGRPLRSMTMAILLCRQNNLGGHSSLTVSSRKYRLSKSGRFHVSVPEPPRGWKTVLYVYGTTGGKPAIISPAATDVPDVLFATR